VDKKLIRIGPDKDGGYLLPDDLEDIKYCFSPGVANCSDFELDMATRGMQVFLADRSVDGPAAEDSRFHFIKKYVASTTSQGDGLITLDDWYTSVLGPVSDSAPEAVLQMDIEGSEYEVLHNLSDSLQNRFRIIIIEFHRLHQLVDRFSFGWMSQALRKLLRTHTVVHIHPNNIKQRVLHYGGLKVPDLMEITFLRNDRFQIIDRPLVFPHPLDRRCVLTEPELVLPECWRS
jgi:hypothetical protein